MHFINDERVSHDALEATQTSTRILAIIYEYALNKFNDSLDRLAAGTPKFLPVIDRFVVAGKPVKMCLPAFPFKSANKVYKVFGYLPDKAEELALERLNSMCARIGEVYSPGASLTIVSDGLVYNGNAPIPVTILLVCDGLLIHIFSLDRLGKRTRSSGLGLWASFTRHGC
jgi:pyoverdine/dityrosine biosynthesis protein Dit1